MKGSGCNNCPVKGCTAAYRGSRCAHLRELAGVDTDPRTNADRILAMSDKELAWTLMVWRCDAAARYHGIESVYPDTQQTVLKWLQQPAEED